MKLLNKIRIGAAATLTLAAALGFYYLNHKNKKPDVAVTSFKAEQGRKAVWYDFTVKNNGPEKTAFDYEVIGVKKRIINGYDCDLTSFPIFRSRTIGTYEINISPGEYIVKLNIKPKGQDANPDNNSLECKLVVK